MKRIHGRDGYGKAVSIGGTDTDGHPVGYIDSDGLSWESRRERDAAIAFGRFDEADIAFNQGRRRFKPVPLFFALRHSRPWNVRFVLRDIKADRLAWVRSA